MNRKSFIALVAAFLMAAKVFGQATNAPTLPDVSTNAPPVASTNAPSKLFDPKDGWLDVSGFLDTAYGFVPMIMPITEPAIGYGAGAGLIFINRNEPAPGQQSAPPDLMMVGGALTENGTWGLLGGYSGWFMENRLQVRAGGGIGSVNLSYHGLGQSPFNDHPIEYNLRPIGGLVEMRYRLGNSPVLAGMGYTFAETKVTFSGGSLPPGVNLSSQNSRLGGVKPALVYDTRNNIFTPTKGIYADVVAGIYDEALGGDSDFQTIAPTFIFYVPLAEKWTLGVNAGAGFAFGNAPFYACPAISLRGAPAREYQARNIAQIETELRWQFWERFSLIGFVGAGTAWNDFDDFHTTHSLITGGPGFRYEIARKYGLHMGIDLAFGPDGQAVYIQFGSAWFRP